MDGEVECGSVHQRRRRRNSQASHVGAYCTRSAFNRRTSCRRLGRRAQSKGVRGDAKPQAAGPLGGRGVFGRGRARCTNVSLEHTSRRPKTTV